MRRLLTFTVPIGLLVVAAVWASRQPGAGKIRARMSVSDVLGGTDVEGYEQAFVPPKLQFPVDHGPHPGFRNEWWYLTGNLRALDGRQFSYQLTFFRNRLWPFTSSSASTDGPVDQSEGSAEPHSELRAEEVFMGHLALTDVGAGRFHAFERFSRAALGLAGATAEPFRVWLEDWSLASLDAGLVGEALLPSAGEPLGMDVAVADGFPMYLLAHEGEVGIELELTPRKPVVLQGEAGLSRKGRVPGNASHYYSYTRLATRGLVRIGGERSEVEGSSWLDREWSTSALESGLVGWDWYALQLSDCQELMFYRLRASDGSTSPFSGGVLVPATGSPLRLSAMDVLIEPIGDWTSPRSGIVYPSGWRLRLANDPLVLILTPVLQDQELDLTFRYWEGAVRVEGQRSGRPIEGVGYVELTGYGPGGRPR